MERVFVLAVAGALGAAARFGLTGLVQDITAANFPWGTLVVNILGCFLVGLCWTLAEKKLVLDAVWRSALFIGFFGSFTTFSTYVLETSELLRAGQRWAAAGNFALNNLLGFLALVGGAAIAQLL